MPKVHLLTDNGMVFDELYDSLSEFKPLNLEINNFTGISIGM